MSKELTQGEKDVALLLAAGGNQRLQARINPSAFLGPKAAADFLFYLGRTEVPFSLVVGERHTRHQGQSQHGLLLLGEAAQQVPSPCALGSAWFWCADGRWFFLLGLAEQLLIPLPDFFRRLPLQRATPCHATPTGTHASDPPTPSPCSISPVNSRTVCA